LAQLLTCSIVDGICQWVDPGDETNTEDWPLYHAVANPIAGTVLIKPPFEDLTSGNSPASILTITAKEAKYNFIGPSTPCGSGPGYPGCTYVWAGPYIRVDGIRIVHQ